MSKLIFKIIMMIIKKNFYCVYNERIIEVESTNKLICYELRTLSRSLTFNFEVLCQHKNDCTLITRLEIDMNKVKNNYEKFLKELNKQNYERHIGFEDKTNGLELFLIDNLGNIKKEKFYF
jgi:hypothetical protein